MASLELIEYLDVIPFPAFILDLDHLHFDGDDPPAELLSPVAANRACRDQRFDDLVSGEVKSNPRFRQWLSLPDADCSAHEQFTDARELDYVFSVVRGRFKIVTSRPKARVDRPLPGGTRSQSWTKAWAQQLPQARSSLHRQHLEHLLTKDWSKTLLGPLEDWPQSLRTMSSYVINCPFPCAMYWGEELAVLYNHEYIAIAHSKHPQALGMAWRNVWSELWGEELGIKSRLLLGMTAGESTRKSNDLLFFSRGIVENEEVYCDWSLIPFPREPGATARDEIIGTGVMVAERGRVGGLVNPAFENTERVLMDRRLRLLREMGQQIARARSTNEYWEILMSSLSEGEKDVPGCVVYGIQEENIMSMVGQIGLSSSVDFFPAEVDLNSLSHEGFDGYVREVLEGGTVVVENNPVLDAFERRGWGDPLKRAVIVRILPSTTRSPRGILFLALSSRRPYDENYSLFVELLARQIATSLSNVQLLEEEIRRVQELAEIDRRKGEELEVALAQRTKELHASQGFMGRLAEICPVGIFVSDASGNITFVNETWYRTTSFPRQMHPTNWITHVHPDDAAGIAEAWKQVFQEFQQITSEFRWVRPGREIHTMAEEDVTWCTMAAAPELDDEGNLVRVFGAIADISERKRVETIQRQRLEEANELRRQQENFIDMISHEMRNPLSAMLQSSDTVLQCLNKVKGRVSPGQIPPEIEDALEAIHTVMLCANHQKRIIDDTLTMSKLDSRLLLITPVDTQPIKVVEKVMRMFENDFASKDIKHRLIIDPSYHALRLDWVKADPSRLTQILVNLLTNAIKFTAGRPRREISVILGPVSTNRPTMDHSGLTSPSLTPASDRDTLFLSFSVADTGSGLTTKERNSLFQKFAQASPETHVNYGGSGLGLYISRNLTEMQGGRIMVESRHGEGSTFRFYIETRRGGPPTPLVEGMVDPMAAAAAELTDSRTESTFLQSGIWTLRDIASVQEKRRPRQPSNLSSYRILIVEDNVINQNVLVKQLQLADCTSIVASNGLVALQVISTSTFSASAGANAVVFDVCLMDIEMPVMDGITACHRIREMEKSGELSRRVPLIAITANAREEQVNRILGEGFDEVLTKPFRVPTLLKMIEGLIMKNQLQ